MLKTRKTIIKISVILFLIVLINILVYNTQKNVFYDYVSGELYESREEVRFTDNFKCETDILNQYFRPQYNHLDAIKIRFAINNSEIDTSDWCLIINLYDEKGDLICGTDVTTKEFENWHDYLFEIDQDVAVNEEYRLEVRQIHGSDDKEWSLSIVCFVAPSSAEENTYCTFNDNRIDGNIEVSYVYRYNDMTKLFPIVVLDIVLILFLLIGCLKKSGMKVFSCLFFACTPIVMFVIVQYISCAEFCVGTQYILKNVFIYYGLYILILCCFGRTRISAIVYGSLLLVVALAEYYVFDFRGQSLMLADIANVGTAAAVMDNYVYQVPIALGIFLLLFVLYLVVIVFCMDFKMKSNGKNRVCRMVGGIALIAVSFWAAGSSDYVVAVNFWNIGSDYLQKGYLYTLFSQIQYMQVDVPDGYSVKKAEGIIDNVEDVALQESSEKISPVNLFVIMNESLADLSVINPIDTDTALLPYINNLQENVCKGYLYVPVFGGGTSDSEYEVLTGNTKQFLPAGGVAYQLYCREPEYGLAANLMESGYEATAVHPHIAANWNRETVYKEMGFDDFISIEDWGDDIDYLRCFASDTAFYDKLIELYEEKESGSAGLFIFGVTMQNHGGYADDSANGYEPTVSLEYEQEYPEAEMYLSLINESDRSFERFLSYFESVKEPTMIVMFGDHQPAVEDEFYEELFGKELSDLNLEEAQLRHKVPYVIWTNYQQEFVEEDMSANYFGSYILQKAGLELTPYNKFLLSLKKTIPVIGMNAVCDFNNKWYPLNALPEEYAILLNEYRILQYNRVFDRENVIEDAFLLNF